MQNKVYTPAGENDMARLMDALEKLKEQDFTLIDETVFDDSSVARKYNETADSLAVANNTFLMRLNDAQIKISDNDSLRTYIKLVERQKEPIEAIKLMGSSVRERYMQLDDKMIAILALIKQAQSTLHPIAENLQSVIDSMPESRKGELEHTNALMKDTSDFLERIKEVAVSSFTTEKIADSFFDEVTEKFHILGETYEGLFNNCYLNGERLYRISREVDNVRNDMYRHNSRPTFIDSLKVFSVDHLTLTWRLFNHMVEYERLRIEQLNNPQGCKFGLWCANLEIEVLKEAQAFKDSMAAHDRIHNHAINCFIAKEESDLVTANAEFELMLEAWKEFDEALNALADFARENGYAEETEI